MKRSFFNRQEVAITLLCAPGSIEEAWGLARNGEMDGADGIAIEMRKLTLEVRTEETLRSIIQAVQLPFMFVDYRNDSFLGADDEARQESLLAADESNYITGVDFPVDGGRILGPKGLDWKPVDMLN